MLATALCSLWCWTNTQAQIFNPKDVLKRKVEQKVNQKIDKKADEIVDSTLDKPQTGKANTDSRDTHEAAAATQVKADNNQAPISMEVYSKYDFIPGEKIVFFDDFSQDNPGDFPAAWNTNGSGEIITTNLFPGKWLKFNSRNAIWTDALISLPENYTIEFDVIPAKGEDNRMAGYEVRLIQSINAKAYDAGSVPGKAGLSLHVEYFGRPGYRTYIKGTEGEGLGLSGYKDDKQLYQQDEHKYHMAIWVQKARVRIYQDQNKLFDLPRAFPVTSVKMDRLRFENGAAMVTNIRIAAGQPDTRNKLLTEGKLVSYGVYFDVNKDVVKPESYGALKEIADVLNENPTLRIRVVGHTDSDGSDADNLDLSRRRAVAVKNVFTSTFGMDASRIETEGKGETQPISANDTPSHKALNRRVEFIRL